MAEVCANTPRITRQQAVVNHLDAGEMHEYSELQSKTTRLTWFFIAPITWFCLRVGPMRATPHSMVYCQNTILRHYDDISPDLSHYKMIYCMTLFIIKWGVAWSTCHAHPLTHRLPRVGLLYPRQGCIIWPYRLPDGIITSCFQHLISICNLKPPRSKSKLLTQSCLPDLGWLSSVPSAWDLLYHDGLAAIILTVTQHPTPYETISNISRILMYLNLSWTICNPSCT